MHRPHYNPRAEETYLYWVNFLLADMDTTQYAHAHPQPKPAPEQTR
jgi:hypothetical protein